MAGDELSREAFDAELAAQSARNAKAVTDISRDEFDRAFAADEAQGLHGDGDGDVELIMVENWNRLLTKTYQLTKDGRIEKDQNRIATGFGRMARVTLARDKPLESLARVLLASSSYQAFMPGQLPGKAAMRRMIVKPRYDALPAADRDLAGDGPLYRGKLCISYTAGKPALLVIDYDAKDLPAALRDTIEKAGGLRAVLAAIDPQWMSVGFVERPSVSTGIRDQHSGVVTTGGGLHVYVIVQDGGDLERYVGAMFDRLTLAGLGPIVVSTAGSYLKRSLIDKAASGIGHTLAFEANAELGPGLEHVPDARNCLVREGARLDTQAMPDLTDDERRDLAGIWATLTEEKAPEARAIRLKRGAKDIERLKQAGVSPDKAQRLVLERHELGRLSLDAVYHFDEALPSGKRSATGWELLANAADWFADGRMRTGSDPLEPDYPTVGSGVIVANKAWWKRNTHSRQPGLFVGSHAHGRQKFSLAYDAHDVVALMDQRKAQGASAIVRLAELKAIYRQYLPADETVAGTILRQAGLPAPIVLEFGDSDAPALGELAREPLLAVLRDKKCWDQLGRLGCLGRFRDEAIAELRDEEAMFEPKPTADWPGIDAWLKTEAKAAAKRAKAAARKEADDQTVAEAKASGLPVIQVRAGQMHKAADQAEAALAAMSKRPVLQRRGDLVRPCSVPAKAADDQDVDAVSLKMITPAMLTDDLAHAATFLRFDERKKKRVPIDPSKPLAEMLLSRTGGYLPRLPRVMGVICAPTLRPDGSILCEPGYDRLTQRYLMPTGKVTLSSALMRAPTRNDALAAVELLQHDLLSEFPFAGDVDRSVGLSLLITPAVRTALRFSPLHLIRAAMAGSGKSYLVNLAHVILSGRYCPAITAGDTPTELEKRINTMLLLGYPMFSLDNLTGDLSSDTLCQALTEPVVAPRVLGQSRTVEVDNTHFTAATGNNVRPIGDLTRRTVIGDLDPQVERPELRAFKSDPVKTVMADRGKYLSACLIVPRAYMVAGMPGVLPPLNGFDDWSNLVRSALVWLGQADPVECMNAVYDDDPGKQVLRAVVAAWKDAGGLKEPLTVKELLNRANASDTVSNAPLCVGFRDALEAAVFPAALSSRSLGVWLRDAKNKVADGVQIVEGRMLNGYKRWCLKPSMRSQPLNPFRWL